MTIPLITDVLPSEILENIVRLAGGPAPNLQSVCKKFNEVCGEVANTTIHKLTTTAISDEYCLLRRVISEIIPSEVAKGNEALKALGKLAVRLKDFYLDKTAQEIHEALTVDCVSEFEQECQDKSLIELAINIERMLGLMTLNKTHASTKEYAEHARTWLQQNSSLLQLIDTLVLTTTTYMTGHKATFTRVPPEIALLTGLKTLEIRDTSIPYLPKEIWQLNLATLNVINSPLEMFDVPDQKLAVLQQLVLSGTKLNKYPQDIEKFKSSLRVLSLEECGIRDIPESIGNLTQLNTLVLTKNSLTTLPDSIGSMPMLRKIEADWNKISLSDEIVFNSLPHIRNMPIIYAYRWYGPLVNILSDIAEVISFIFKATVSGCKQVWADHALAITAYYLYIFAILILDMFFPGNLLIAIAALIGALLFLVYGISQL